jgi:hypothetical protein
MFNCWYSTYDVGKILHTDNIPFTERFKKLSKLNLSSTHILSAPRALARSYPDTSDLSITSLSFADKCTLQSSQWSLYPPRLSFVRSLTVSLNYHVDATKISRLLPQLTSLTILNRDPDIARCVTLSTSLKLLSLPLHVIAYLDLDTRRIIRDRIEVLRIVIDGTPSSDPSTALSAIVSGTSSRVLNKVIVDGSKSSDYGHSVSHTINKLVPLCKKAKVELWKENCKVGNGKVDLDSE